MAAGHSMKTGEEFKEGTDKVRYKEVERETDASGTEMAYSEDDLTDLCNTIIPPEAEKIGMKFEGTKMDFAQMINHLNREGC